ncbi:MAG TPA: hypothetical protein DCO79_12675 [Spirochaeta sp.]|nr:hypothetical protein [Spirochaeta sp.]
MMPQIVLIFFIFAFMGWIIEFVFRAFDEKHIGNPGLLKGPWLPVYGLTGVIIFLVSGILADHSILLRMLFYLILCTAFEFIAGEFLGKIFHKRLWDYSNYKYNLRGLICPAYSAGWVLIAVLVELFILPEINSAIILLSPSDILKAIVPLISVFTVDFLISSGIASREHFNRLKDLIG